MQINDSYLDDIILQALRAKTALLEDDSSRRISVITSPKNSAANPNSTRRRSFLNVSSAYPPSYLLLKKIFQNTIFLTHIIHYLEDNEKLWFDLFLRDFYDIFNKLAVNASIPTNYDDQAMLQDSQKNELLTRALNDYHDERSKFIQNLMKHRQLQKQSQKLRGDYIETILWKNERLFGERLRQEYWNERMEIAVRLGAGYRGNIHQYLQTCKSLREKYILFKEKAVDHLNESKELRIQMLEEVEMKTKQFLDEVYVTFDVKDNIIDDELATDTSFSHESSEMHSDALESRVISNKIMKIKQKFEDDIGIIVKHHEKWKANHIRRMLKDSLMGRIKFQRSDTSLNSPTTPLGQSHSQVQSHEVFKSESTLSSSSGSHDEKLLEYQINSLEESKDFVKHIVDVLERCVNMVNKNSEKKANQIRTMMVEIKAPIREQDMDKLQREHFQTIETGFQAKLKLKLDSMDALEKKMNVKRKESIQKAKLEFEKIKRKYDEEDD